MRYLLLILAFSIGNLRAQSDTTKYFKSVDYGWRYQRFYTPLVFAPPQDTLYGKWGLAMKGNSLFLGNGSKWTVVGSGGGGTPFDTASYVKRTELLDSLSSVRDAYQQYTNDYVNENNVAYIDPILATKVNIADSVWRYVTPTQLSNYLQSGTDISVKSVNVTGTNGSGHINLRHQATDPTSGGQQSTLFAASDGRLKYKNDGNPVSNIATTDDLTGLATTSSVNSALALKLNIADTAAMLTNYVRKSQGTYAQRIALTPSVGQQFYQTNELEGLYIYNGTTWLRDATGLLLQEEFCFQNNSTTALSLGYFTTAASGTGATAQAYSLDVATANYNVGNLFLVTGTTTTGFARFNPSQTGNAGSLRFIGNNSVTYFETAVLFGNLSDATDTYVFKIGYDAILGVTTSAASTGFRYTHSENSGTFSFQYHNSSGTTTNVSTGVTVAAITLYRLGFKIIAPNNISGLENGTIEVYVNGTLTNTLTQRTNSLLGHFPTAQMLKTSGTTSRSAVIDYVKFYKLR